MEDFARQETDELGFLRNDIITVLDMHDEHCWLGELNGLRGWFPAKLVELLDERSKRYTPAGDDTVYPNIGHLVRQGGAIPSSTTTSFGNNFGLWMEVADVFLYPQKAYV
ncbi:unnamed protein product [Dibothriocephalus latus]|uniref:SH3 domain-containing protein n=1 Tax=Dibothriocephalus latus TaxID=60516 RepID=A0A3P7N130_DIBLA|nr:unnamed protein product [Dibothriocephalus latus]